MQCLMTSETRRSVRYKHYQLKKENKEKIKNQKWVFFGRNM